MRMPGAKYRTQSPHIGVSSEMASAKIASANRCPYRRCGVDTEIPYRLPFWREFCWVLPIRVASGVDTECLYRVRIVNRGLIAATLFAVTISDSQIILRHPKPHSAGCGGIVGIVSRCRGVWGHSDDPKGPNLAQKANSLENFSLSLNFPSRREILIFFNLCIALRAENSRRL